METIKHLNEKITPEEKEALKTIWDNEGSLDWQPRNERDAFWWLEQKGYVLKVNRALPDNIRSYVLSNQGELLAVALFLADHNATCPYCGKLIRGENEV